MSRPARGMVRMQLPMTKPSTTGMTCVTPCPLSTTQPVSLCFPPCTAYAFHQLSCWALGPGYAWRPDAAVGSLHSTMDTAGHSVLFLTPLQEAPMPCFVTKPVHHATCARTCYLIARLAMGWRHCFVHDKWSWKLIMHAYGSSILPRSRCLHVPQTKVGTQ